MPRGSASALVDEMTGGGGGGSDIAASSAPRSHILSGTCPDASCQTKLSCLSSAEFTDCTGCGQRHRPTALQNVTREQDSDYNTTVYAIRSLIAGMKPEPGTDNIKVRGLSNYKCKLLSPLLSHYGMDKSSGRAKLLTDMGQPPVFDCGVLCDRAFCIDPEHMEISGYGRDSSGSMEYLKDTLNLTLESNGKEERLVPLHADGDGHCLVHAISRALVGRELFYHPLRLNLLTHFQQHLSTYKELFKNFVDADEWDDIVDECGPNFIPKEGEGIGLRNIHIFGLANVLKRPIILLDSPKGIESSGDYSGVFLPALLSPSECKNKEGVLNPPLCIAWSSKGRNHFIPLVGIKGKPCPVLPRYMLQTTWGVLDPTLLDAFINFQHGCCTVGGARMLQESYIQRLVAAMEDKFMENYSVHPELVADVHRYIYRSKGYLSLDSVTERTKTLVAQRSLVFCLCCSSLFSLGVEPHMLRPGGELYNLACKDLGSLKANKIYIFKEYNISCKYNFDLDVLEPEDSEAFCPFCKSEGKFRYVCGDRSVEYQEGDLTREPAGPRARCGCGFKHFYGGKLYDNRPRELPVPLDWGGKTVVEVVQWWDGESDSALDSNAYQVATALINKHFPGEFGIELLEQRVVSAILRLTALKDENPPEGATGPCDRFATATKFNPHQASKIIMSGYQTQSIHKEELTASETERQMRKNIEANAPLQQAKKSGTGEATLTANGPLHQAKKSGAGEAANSSPGRTVTAKNKMASNKASPGTPPSTPKPSGGESVGSNSKTEAPPNPAVKSPSNEKKVRIVSDSGHSETVTLREELTFSQLQQVVQTATQISPRHQKLRLGFPPKVLGPPSAGQEDGVVPLNHGDKISVENIGAAGVSAGQPSARGLVRRHTDDHMPDEEAMLSALAARHTAVGGDPIDGSLISLGLLAARMGEEVWGVVQRQPHHFSVGGVYHRQAARDLGLHPGKHCTFPSLPGKRFCYNADLDRLELCLGDLGHFEVEPDVERKAQQQLRLGHNPHTHHNPHQHTNTTSTTTTTTPATTTTTQPSSGSISHLRDDDNPGWAGFGSSGAVKKNMAAPSKIFEGQGHSLRGGTGSMDAKMPEEDVPLTENIRGAARRLQDFCDPAHGNAAIREEPEGMEVAEVKAATGAGGEGHPKPKYTRKGPGYSVLEPPPPPPPPVTTMDAMQQLFRNLQDVIAASEQMDDDEGEEGEMDSQDVTTKEAKPGEGGSSSKDVMETT